jgi:uncharacterized glyoxalase superfamily protein PhnB
MPKAIPDEYRTITPYLSLRDAQTAIEFYKLALDDPALQANLAKVRTFYEPWGDPRGLDFRK